MGHPEPLLLRLAGLLLGMTMACARSGSGEGGPRFSRDPLDPRPEYVFAVHPLHNPARLFAVYGPILDRIRTECPDLRIRLEASKDYHTFEEKLDGRRVHFALPNPYQTIRCQAAGYRIFGKMGDDHNFRGIILVRRDSGIDSIRDLKGRSIGYPAPTALAATLMPQYFLQTHGLDVARDTRSVYVGTQESVIMNVYLKLTDAGATWPVPWLKFVEEHPREAGALVIKWQTGTLPNNGLVVRDDVPEAVARSVERILFSLHQDPEGRRMLSRIPLSRFEPADAGTYAPVQAFMKRFSAKVRPMGGQEAP